jgi:DNA-binding XRE family transcriptional regulator
MNMNWGKAFSLIRDKAGRKQGEVAKSIGISQESLSQIELGKKNPREETVAKFGQAFGLDANYVALVATLTDMKPEEKARLEKYLNPGLLEEILEYVQ